MTDRRSWKVLGRLIRWNAHRTMSHYYFFPDFSPATTTRRKTFNPVLKKMTSLGLQPFLIYPAVIKLWHKGEQRMFDSPQKAEDFISSLSQQKTYAAALQGNGRTAATISQARREGLGGWDGGGPSCPGGDDGKDMDACWTCFLLFLLSSLLLGYCPYLSGTTISLLVRLTTFFLFWRGLMESRFNYNNFLAVWAFQGTCFALKWIGHVHHYFLLLNQTYVLGNVRSELFLVYDCRLFMFLCCFYFLQQTFILLFILPYF